MEKKTHGLFFFFPKVLSVRLTVLGAFLDSNICHISFEIPFKFCVVCSLSLVSLLIYVKLNDASLL